MRKTFKTLRKKPSRKQGAQPTVLDALESRMMFAHGLTGVYFLDQEFATPSHTSIDQTIDFNWGGFSVASTNDGDADSGFSARWTGRLVAKFSEYYTFFVQSGGGVRLWVNDRLLIEEPDNSAGGEFAGKMTMKFLAGQTYNIRLDYVDRQDGMSNLSLLWKSTRTEKQIVPHTRLRSEAKTPVKYRISFRDAGSERPEFYRLDNGKAYGARGLGYYYGWDQDNTAYTFDRDSSRSYSERYDGGALMQPNGQNRSWSIKVPNGMYNVRVVAGDAEFTNSVYSIDVEGKAVVRGKPNQYSHWFDGTVTVTVSDGNLTLTNGVGAVNNKISFVEISQARESDRFIAFLQVGLTDNNPARRFLNNGLEQGWKAWAPKYLDPLLEQGYTRIHLHNPFGVGDKWVWELDSFLRAKEAGLTWATDDFVETFKPVTAKGIEIIAYIGPSDAGPEWGTTEEQWMARFWAAVQPMVDAKVSIAFDSACLVTEDSYLYKAAQMLQAKDIKVYIESRPMLNTQQWSNFGLISEEAWWDRSDPNLHGDAKNWAVPNDQITGEVLRWVYYPPEGYDWNDTTWRVPQMQDALKEGHTLLISPTLAKEGISMNWLIARMNGYMGEVA